MKNKIYIILAILLLFIPIIYGIDLDDDRTLYYPINSTGYGADGINSTDLGLSGTPQSNGDSALNGGWVQYGGAGTIYTNAFAFYGSVSLYGDDDAIQTPENYNGSFTGIYRMSVYCETGDVLTIRLHTTGADYKYRMTISGGNIDGEGYETDNSTWYDNTISSVPLNDWFNVSIEMNATSGGIGTIKWTVNDTPLQEKTGYGYYGSLILAYGVGGGCYVDNLMITNNGLVEKGEAPPPVSSNPSVKFNKQIPQDLNLTNFIGSDKVNITYNITDSDGLNATEIKLYYKTNSTVSDIMYYTNGSATSGYLSTIDYTNESNIYEWGIDDNDILPASYNIYEEGVETTPHSTSDLTGNTDILSVELLNVSNNRQYGFFEAMINRTAGSGALTVYYCNSSYIFNSDPDSSDNCVLFYTKTTDTYDHTHTSYSSHIVAPFPVNTSSGQILDIGITSKSNFLIRGATSTTWTYSHISNLTGRSNVFRTSSNNGNTWADQSDTYTVDAHIHQLDSDTSFYYYACADDLLGNQNCTGVRQDLLEFGGLPPSSPVVTFPDENKYNGLINITYQKSESPNAYDISKYNISLYDTSFSFLQVIKSDNGVNLSYLWNSTSISDGNYLIGVYAIDEIGQSSIGFSDNFTIDATPPNINVLFPSPLNLSYNFNMWINLTTNEASVCSVNDSVFSLTVNPNSSYFGFYESTLSSGNYDVFISCNDTSIPPNNASTIIYFSKDLEAPIIKTGSPLEDNSTEFINTGSMRLLSNISDNIDLYRLNVSISYVDALLGKINVYNLSVNLSGTAYQLDELISTSTWDNTTFTQVIKVCDSHTASMIDDAQAIIKDNENNDIKFQMKDQLIDIKSLQATSKINTIKSEDRYSFNFDFYENPKIKQFEIRCDNIDYIPNSGYKGHFVCGDYWVDFEQDGDVIVEERFEIINNISSVYYLVRVDNPDSSITFNSIGQLNCVEEHYQFNIVSELSSKYNIGLISFNNWFNYDELNTSTTAGVLLFFFLFIIFVSMIIFGEYIQIPAIMLLTSIYGIFFGILLYVSISAIVGLLFIILSVMYFIRAGVGV